MTWERNFERNETEKKPILFWVIPISVSLLIHNSMLESQAVLR